MFVISMFILPKMAPAGAKCIWGKVWFQPDVKLHIQRLEQINCKIYRTEMSVSFNQTCLKEKILLIYIYIYIRKVCLKYQD